MKNAESYKVSFAFLRFFFFFFFFVRGSQILMWLNYIFSPLFIKGYAGLEKITYSHILDKTC